MHHSSTTIIEQLPDFLDFLEIEKGLSTKTQENYSRFLHRFTKWLQLSKMDTLLPHELTTDHIWKYRVFLSRQTKAERGQNQLKKSTQNYYLIALRMFLSFFAEKDIISLPPEKVKLAKQPKEKKLHFLNLQELEQLILSPNTKSTIGLRDRGILETLFSTGLRVSELTALDRDQINLKGKPAFLEITVVGKGSKPRIVYFSERCLHWLGEYLKTRQDLDKALFINYKKGSQKLETRRLTPRSIEDIVKKYTKMAGLPIITTPHTLRHSYATDLLSNGVDLRLIQEFLGHSSISTTQIYTHVTNKGLREVYLKHHGGKKMKGN